MSYETTAYKKVFGERDFHSLNRNFGWKIFNGRSEKVLLKHLDWWKAQGIDAIVQDPPYGTGLEKWDKDQGKPEIYEYLLEILRPGGYMACYCGSRYYHRLASILEKQGWIIRDMLLWCFDHRTSKGEDIGQAIISELKEFILNSPYEKGNDRTPRSLMREVKKHIGDLAHGFRPDLMPSFDPIILCQKKPRKGDYASTFLTHRVGALNIKDTGKIRADGKSETKYLDGRYYPIGRYETQGVDDDAKNRGIIEPPRGIKNAWGAGSGNQPNDHISVKDVNQTRWLIKLMCPKGGKLLDCFNGSGTTGIASIGWCSQYYGIEMDPHFVRISNQRLLYWNQYAEYGPDNTLVLPDEKSVPPLTVEKVTEAALNYHQCGLENVRKWEAKQEQKARDLEYAERYPEEEEGETQEEYEARVAEFKECWAEESLLAELKAKADGGGLKGHR